MRRTLEELEAEAMQLEPEARERLAQHLLRTLQPSRPPRPRGDEGHPVDQVYGLLAGAGDESTDELIEAMRGR